ncbi:MAG TPA: hypothetical protein VG097_04215, partial [Gemmata sp.]|nr:hypothetical protein [Gemmata sp.]
MKLFGNIILLFGLAVLVVGCSKKSNNAPAVESKSGKAIDLATDFLGQDFQDPVPESQSVNEPEAAARVPAKSKGLGSYTIGKSTTYVTGPIDADGHIDYAMASNERLGRGATTENNAAVLIWKAIGPHPDNATQPAKFYELLGVEIPEKGDYFVSLNQYLEKVAKSDQTIAVSLDGLTQLGREAWTANEHPDIDRWLKANEKQLAMIIDATKRTCYYSPTVPPRNDKGSTGLINTLLPGLQITRVLAAALAARAMLSLGQGDHDAAWQDLLACHRLGRLVGQGGLLIEGLVGLSL